MLLMSASASACRASTAAAAASAAAAPTGPRPAAALGVPKPAAPGSIELAAAPRARTGVEGASGTAACSATMFGEAGAGGGGEAGSAAGRLWDGCCCQLQRCRGPCRRAPGRRHCTPQHPPPPRLLLLPPGAALPRHGTAGAGAAVARAGAHQVEGLVGVPRRQIGLELGLKRLGVRLADEGRAQAAGGRGERSGQ
jgi:hypothetical protein